MDQTIIPVPNVEHPRPPPLHVPAEICENVIDMLYSHFIDEAFTNKGILHSCALVCRDWRVRAQRMLFYRVQLADMTSLRLLSAILDDSQHLRDYVYEVQLTGYNLHNTMSVFALFPAVFARKLPNLFWIDVTHRWQFKSPLFPEISGVPKAKALPYIPLHPRFPTFLSAFTTVSELDLYRTIFRTFSEFSRMLHGLPALKRLVADSVVWLSPGSFHPGADFSQQLLLAASGKDVRPPFAPELRDLVLSDVATYGARRLLWRRGPYLTCLALTIPLLRDPKGLAYGDDLSLRSFTGLQELKLFFSSKFAMDAHGRFVSELLASWQPQHSDPILQLLPHVENAATRREFAEALRGVGTIAEAWLHQLQHPHPATEIPGHHHHDAKYQPVLVVKMNEREAERERWLDHLETCFPTWSMLGKLKLVINTPRNVYEKWEDEDSDSTQSDASGPSEGEQRITVSYP